MDQVIEFSQLVNGEYQQQRLTLDQIIAERGRREKPKKPSIKAPDPKPQVGILSRTVIQSPVINYVLPARIRHREKNDVALIGEDFIHLKETREDGTLKHVATKTGLPLIRAARVFGEPTQEVPEDLPIKMENGIASELDMFWERASRSPPLNGAPTRSLPPQLLVLTMETQQLLFLFALTNDRGVTEFYAHSIAMYSGSSILSTPGPHLAVDPKGRAVAVGAPERSLMLYSTCWPEEVTGFSKIRSVVTDELIESVAGSILKVEFLFPAQQDDDHVILVILHTEGAMKDRICITCFDWLASRSLGSRQRRLNAVPLSLGNGYPLLLVPLRYSPDCMIFTENDVLYYRNILAGDLNPMRIFEDVDETPETRVTKLPPRWTSWTRADRLHRVHGRVQEDLYFVREDGSFYYVEASNGDTAKDASFGISFAGSFRCNIDTAFASLPVGLKSPDHLIAVGCDGEGGVLSIGQRQKHGTKLTREQLHEPWLVEPILNWSPTMDVTTDWNKSLSHEQQDSSLLATSGRAPYGGALRLRNGISANVLAQISTTTPMTHCTGLWILSTEETADLTLLISFPTHTGIVHIFTVKDEGSELIEVEFRPHDMEDIPIAIDTDTETLAAASLPFGNAIQVTRQTIRVFSSSTLNSTLDVDLPSSTTIIAAAIQDDYLVIATTSDGGDTILLQLGAFRENCNVPHLTWMESPLSITSEPTCIAFLDINDKTFIAVATRSGEILFYDVSPAGHLRLRSMQQIPCQEPRSRAHDSVQICESFAVISADSAPDILLCGMRDGHLLVLETNMAGAIYDESDMELDLPQFFDSVTQRWYCLGMTSVRLFQCSTYHVFLVCDDIFCRATRPLESGTRLDIRRIWFDDKNQMNFPQLPVSRLIYLPDNESMAAHGLSETLLCASGTDLFSVSVEGKPMTVPATIPVKGTASRILLDQDGDILIIRQATSATERDNGSVVARSRCALDVLDKNQNIGPENAVHLHSTRATYELSRGERANCLELWSLHDSSDQIPSLGDDKRSRYSFIVIGMTFTDAQNPYLPIGQVLFLRKTVKNGSVVLKRSKISVCKAGPVYSIANLRRNALVYGTGNSLIFIEFDFASKRINNIGEYSRLPSPAVHITVSSNIVYVTTRNHSVHAFLFTEEPNPDLDSGIHSLPRDPPSSMRIEVTPFFTDRFHRQSNAHLLVDLPSSTSSFLPSSRNTTLSEDRQLILVADKTSSITGLLQPVAQTLKTAAPVLFSAPLPRSVTRLRFTNTRPRWVAASNRDVLPDNIIGSAADGTLLAFSVLGRCAWQVLKALECLMLMSTSDSSMALPRHPSVPSPEQARNTLLSIAAIRSEEAVRNSNILRPQLTDADYHVDGDLLAPLKEVDSGKGIREMVDRADSEVRDAWESLVEEFAHDFGTDRDARLGDWVMDVLDEVL